MSADTEDQKHMPWNEGLPTKPDVDALLKAFPPEAIKPGEWRVTDAEMKAVIGRCDGARYRTVYSAWRKRLKRDHRVIVHREETVGFYCPTWKQVGATVHPAYEHMGRTARGRMTEVQIAQPSTEEERAEQQHYARLLHTTNRVLKKDRMNVLPPTESIGQPQISPPKSVEK